MNNKKYSLIGIDGNAFSIMGYVSKAMKRTGYSREDIDKYLKSAQSSDYYNLVQVSLNRIEEINEKIENDV